MLNLQSRSMKHHLASLIGVVLIGGLGIAQQTETPKKPSVPPPSVAPQEGATPESPPPGRTVRRAPRGRLPAYFSAIVSQKQRGQIYTVQAQYSEKINTLRMQINQLLAERDRKVDSVLTPEQLSDVNERRAAATARRKSRRAGPLNSVNQ